MSVFFTYEKKKENWGSTTMRGFDISKLLGVDIIPNTEINDKKNCKIICLKSDDYSKYLKLSENNEVIIDMNDFKPIDNLDIFKNFSCGIFTSQSQLEKFGELFKYPEKNIVIYHHWDNRLSNITISDNGDVKIGYFGTIKKCHLYKKINDIEFNIFDGNGFEKSLNLYERYNVHYVIKPPKQENLIQSMIKLANASLLSCPVICVNEKQYHELLTEDYPYYCLSHNRQDILNTIELIRETYKKDEWFKAVEILKEVKNKTSIENAIKNYKTTIL